MRTRIAAGVLLTLALLVPAAPAVAQPATPAPAAATCAAVLHTDIRKLITINLETATDDEVQDAAELLLAAARADSLAVLPGVIETKLGGTAAELYQPASV